MIERRAVAFDNLILHCTVGSKLHGINVDGQDDTDEMGICIPDPKYVIGLETFDQYTYRTQPEGVRSGPGDLDLVIYELRKWMRLAVAGNPSILLPLFAPETAVTQATHVGRALRGEAERIVSKQAGHRFLGYLRAQRDRAQGRRGQARVPNRPELVAAHGYDTKYAGHMIRLGFQGIELMETGKLTLPMPAHAREQCLRVRRGEVSGEEAMDTVNALEASLENAMKRSWLPEHPDRGKINELLCIFHRQHWGMI